MTTARGGREGEARRRRVPELARHLRLREYGGWGKEALIRGNALIAITCTRGADLANVGMVGRVAFATDGGSVPYRRSVEDTSTITILIQRYSFEGGHFELRSFAEFGRILIVPSILG